MEKTVTDQIDVVIYISGQDSAYYLNYQVLVDKPDVFATSLQTRMLKSYSLGRDWPDAKTKMAIEQKAKLMQTIFLNEYGLCATIQDLTA